MKIVLDSNVLLAGLATRGVCETVVITCIDSHELVISEPILEEVATHLQGKFKMPAAMVRDRIAFLRRQSRIVEPQPVPLDSCRDPDDLMVLGTAVAGQADCLITGDEDLLILRQFRDIPILSPRQFYRRLS